MVAYIYQLHWFEKDWVQATWTSPAISPSRFLNPHNFSSFRLTQDPWTSGRFRTPDQGPIHTMESCSRALALLAVLEGQCDAQFSAPHSLFFFVRTLFEVYQTYTSFTAMSGVRCLTLQCDSGRCIAV